jgi:chromosome segregation ATPase
MFLAKATVVAALVVGAAAVGHTQSSTDAKPSRASTDDLLTEVRALHADLQQIARISIRTQLLVARLRLQEQRINVLAGQLAEARRLLLANEAEQGPVVRDLQRAEDGVRDGSIPSEQVKEAEYMIGNLKAKLAQARQVHQQLDNQAMDLSNQLTTEQSRWTDFNSRSDDLEQLLPVVQR